MGDRYKKIIKQLLYGKIVQKYRIQSVVRSSFIPQLKKTVSQPRDSCADSVREYIIKNSQIDPGKKAYITRNKEKRQIQWLNASMLDLHIRYCIEVKKISYKTFTRYRPFFVKFLKSLREILVLASSTKIF